MKIHSMTDLLGKCTIPSSGLKIDLRNSSYMLFHSRIDFEDIHILMLEDSRFVRFGIEECSHMKSHSNFGPMDIDTVLLFG